ncbi:heterokaryon incompatibility protein-domain-containing protein [Leptodontidium sp. MPI-SDFR-AT-0119]|nr:heterokaryon incompatibility protein-domain-containing protein [Leptodontidium sp. MPI-SDFR-AT-0119]
MSFEYPPFTEPRQIRLLKASFNQTHNQPDIDTIQCEFLVVNLDDLPCEYVAISYLWGSSEKPNKVWCDGFSIAITVSAMSVLHMAASNSDLGYIWIDALCIDQSNASEKAVQIRLMRDVYPAAKSTIAWLGDSTPITDEALEFIVTLNTALKKFEHDGVVNISRSSLLHSEGCEWPSSSWKALSTLLEHPWFRRVWILQEMALASQVEIVCGKRSVPWLLLAFIVVQIEHNGLMALLMITENGELNRGPIGLSTLKIAWGLRCLRAVAVPLGLASLLVDYSFLEASDDRDRLFALLGIADDVEDSSFEPDYITSPPGVFLKSAVRLLTRDGSSNMILHRAGIGSDRNMEGLPSWVPDWTKHHGNTVLGSLASIASYHASEGIIPPTNAIYSEDQQSIALSGCNFDKITEFTPPYPESAYERGSEEYPNIESAFMAWLDCLQILCSSAGVHPNGQSYYPDILWRTLVAGIDYSGNPAPDDFQQHFQDLTTRAEDGLRAISEDRDLEANLDLDESARKFVATMSAVSFRRRVFATQLGYLGLGPLRIEVGDRICVFLGFDTPFVIRPRDEGGYVLVGECYIYGLMNGEALVDGKVEDITLY